MSEFATAALGLVILLLAGDSLVRGAVNMSLRLGVPALLVSLTVVAFGTSAPELLIAVSAVIERAPGLAMGNVVGSNIANVLLVLGVPAIISRIHSGACDVKQSYWIMIASTLLFIGIALTGRIHWLEGIVLLAALAGILTLQARQALSHRRSEAVAAEEIEEADPSMRWWKIFLYVALGLVGLPLGANILVDSSTEIAARFGVSDAIIGLTLVAVGTSLPELATTVMAAIRRQADVALGNVIGSNMFNLLAIIGVASFFGDLPIDREILRFDLWVMLAAAVLLGPFVLNSRLDLTRRVGIGMVSLYAIYVWMLVMMA